jgi:quercetin dioxygenase-like cupin family protein
MNSAFDSFPWKHGRIADLDRKCPSYLSAWLNGALALDDWDTHFGYVAEGPAVLMHEGRHHLLHQGMYFCVPGYCEIVGKSGRGVIISREQYRGMFSIGGPIEYTGRLQYIDGCTDSLLVAPVMQGDPCLNLLFFPPGVDQTAHTHPSDRIGMILSGSGECLTGDGTLFPLVPNMLFCIRAEGVHKFRTSAEQDLRVLAYHPDSDFGPTHQVHPMKSRTIIDGISASDDRRKEFWT